MNQDDFQQTANELIGTLRNEGIKDEIVLEKMRTTPREQFIPEELHHLAYENRALPIDCDQTISQPYIVALMTQAAEISDDDTVLEIGTGSGYQTAILAQLAKKVVSIERHESLSNIAQQRLESLELTNINYQIGDGTLGCDEFAPYNAILVTAAAPHVPGPLYEQLAQNGRLVIPVGDANQQELMVIKKTAAGPVEQRLCACRFVKLLGEQGWSELDS